ncbi:MAG: hypothetical protein ACR2PA_09025 [Hyphomicrobiaceae bacterium]
MSMDQRPSLTRRSVLTGLGCCACCGPAIPALAQRFRPRTGCVVRGREAQRVLGSGVLSSNLGDLPEIVKGRSRTTGRIDLNRQLDRALQRLAKTFDVWPQVGFYDDGDQPNAMAVWFEEGGRRTYAVVFGRTYFQTLFKYDPSGISFLQTAAHEFGHIWMYKSGQLDTLLEGQSTVKRAELHADFLSGYYLGLRKRDNPQESFRSAGMKRWESGDTFIRDQDHHGTPQQRLAAAEAGFRLGFLENAPPAAAFAAATRYVRAL